MDEQAFRELISGDRTGITPALLRSTLSGLSLFYGCGVRIRNRLFDLGIRRTHHATVPVVSVGNITTGGTGKTPFVAFLANRFRAENIRVVLLSRGYGALHDEVNDEKLVLDQLCPDVPHLQNPNRVESARIACRDHHSQLLILDDGFQHRRLARDVDIVLVDALNPWGYGHLLPRGLLREPLTSLQRADLVVITRADQCSREAKDRITGQIASIRGSDECVEVAYPFEDLINADSKTTEVASLHGKRIGTFCGIGNPDAFRQTLLEAGLRVELFQRFPDHHHYQVNELDDLIGRAKQLGLDALITTQKDLVKIKRSELDGISLWAARIGVRILQGKELLERQLAAIGNTAP